jgi:predicted dehydrogenase
LDLTAGFAEILIFMATRRKVGFAVVGLGSIAQGSVLPAFSHSKKARLVAVVSRDKRKAARLARRFRAPMFYSCDEYAACLADPEIDAVYVATPQGEHAPATVQAAQAGKHVLCEKPLAATVEQSAQMVDACKKNRVLLMTAYRKYFEPGTRFLKELIQSGDLGRIDVIHTAFSELHVPGKSLDWLLDPILAGGGPLMDLGIYCVNTSRWLVEEDPLEVNAELWRHDALRFREVEEGISFRMHFPSGLVVQGCSSYGAAISSFIYVQGTKGWASMTPAFDFSEERRLTGKIAGRPVDRRFKVMDEFAPELDAFASAIQNKRKIDPDGVQGHRDMIILQSIYESAKNREPVVVGYG